MANYHTLVSVLFPVASAENVKPDLGTARATVAALTIVGTPVLMPLWMAV